MSGFIAEWYGYPASDMSDVAAKSAEQKWCPFLDDKCKKKTGICSVEVSERIVTTCPNRLYGDTHKFLRNIARMAFKEHFAPNTNNTPDRINLVKASEAVWRAQTTGEPQVGVFGHGWGNEITLPPMRNSTSRYLIDFTLVYIDSDGQLLGFTPIEVQTIDTTNSTKVSLEGLQNGRQTNRSTVGLNWENVNKRILPQLITKGLMLQGERLCNSGIYFVTIDPVYDKIMERLGGENRFRKIPRQPGSITFISYQQDDWNSVHSKPLPLTETERITISTSDMSLAFISPQNLPPAGAFEETIIDSI